MRCYLSEVAAPKHNSTSDATKINANRPISPPRNIFPILDADKGSCIELPVSLSLSPTSMLAEQTHFWCETSPTRAYDNAHLDRNLRPLKLQTIKRRLCLH